MARTSRVMVFHQAGQPLELRHHSLPKLDDGEVLVRVTGCTLCGSDIHTYDGRRSTRCPTVLGHEIIGRVEELPSGSGVCDFDGSALEIGDRITWSVAASCGNCFFCDDGLPQKCERLFKYGHERITDSHALSGGLAEHCHLARGTAIFRVPDELPDAVACPANCATATAAAAMRYAGSCAGHVVLVQGAGMLGLTAAAMAAAGGASEVIVCDKLAERLTLASSFGATQTVCVTEDDISLRETAEKATGGRGVDIAIDMSGAPEAIEAGVDLLRVGGHYVWVGAVFPTRSVAVSPETVVRKILSLQGVHNYTPSDLRNALEFLEHNHRRFPFEQLVGETFTLEDAGKAFAHASQSRALRVAVKT
ncbi:MAG: zinc-binding dehydrogenase [Planctomycetes bacterium]|nr:zinc-binding dehydrogenase [Planctomycetota bacterium]